MDILGKNIDPVVFNKIMSILNSPEGSELKKQFQGMDKEKLMQAFSQLKFSNDEIVSFNNRIKDLSQSELMNEVLKKMKRG